MNKELQNLITKFCPHLDLKIIFNNSKSIASFFKFKDKIPQPLCSCIVYKFTCSCCQAEYVGSTKRHLKTRIDEHIGVSSRTNQPLKNIESNIYNHCYSKGHQLISNDFKIIDQSNNIFLLRTLESIHIHLLKPCLNDKNSSAPLAIT